MSELLVEEGEEVTIVRVWLQGRWRGSERRFSVGATVVIIISSSLVAVLQAL